MLELDAFINRIKHLPPAPRVLPELLPLLNRPDTPVDRVVRLISFDPALTAGVLQLSNSTVFAGTTPVSNLTEAVSRLGFKETFQLVVAISSSHMLNPPQAGYGFDAGDLWKHSVVAALAAKLMASELGDDENVVFTAALLHDLGKIVLAHALEDTYTQLMAEVIDQQHSLIEAEKRILGVQHAEIGGRLLTRWKFPQNLTTAVYFHHNPGAARPHHRLASYVYLGNMIAYFMGHGYGHAAFAFRGRAEALEILNLSGDSLPRYMIQTLEHFASVEALLKLRS